MDPISLKTLTIFLIAAGLIVPAFKHLKVSPVLGFMLVGLLVGPLGLLSESSAAWLDLVVIPDHDRPAIKTLAEVGVIFLLFMIGLDLSFERLWSMRRLVLGLGNAQILATAAAIAAIAYAWGNSGEAAIIIGGCLALSSTALVLQLLSDQGRFGSPAGHSSFSILLAQDLAVVPLLFLASTFAASSTVSATSDLLLAIGRAATVIGLVYLVGRIGLRPLLRYVGKLASPELLVATTLLILILAASATHAAGLSAALGAFLAGLLVAESEYHNEIELYIEPFRGLLLGMFFMSVAMDIDLAAVSHTPLLIAMSVLGLIAFKVVLTTAATRMFGFSWAHAVETGVLLAQGGEFAFVVLGLAMVLGVVPEATSQFMLIVVSGSMFLTPFLAELSTAAAALLEKRSPPASAADQEELSNHVILVGFGRTGHLLAELLNHAMVPFIALDKDPDVIARDPEVMLGDGTRIATLLKLRIESARALVICVNDPNTVEHMIDAGRRANSSIPMFVRAHDEDHARRFVAKGATTAVPEVLESGLTLADGVLREMGFKDHAAGETIMRLRSRRCEGL